jgi:hypothetical protein
MKLFTAEIETRSSHSHGYGITAEEAVKALLDTWRTNWCPATGADPSLLAELREELTIHEIETGRGYVIGSNDLFSRPIVLRGNHQSLDSLFEEYLLTPSTPKF